MPLVVNVNTPGCSMQLEVLQGVRSLEFWLLLLDQPNCVQNLDSNFFLEVKVASVVSTTLVVIVFTIGGNERPPKALVFLDDADHFTRSSLVEFADDGGHASHSFLLTWRSFLCAFRL
jgi:hypothetical protein